jgi:hypothetical protein
MPTDLERITNNSTNNFTIDKLGFAAPSVKPRSTSLLTSFFLTKVKIWLVENLLVLTGANGHVAHAVCSATMILCFVKVAVCGTMRNANVFLRRI